MGPLDTLSDVQLLVLVGLIAGLLYMPFAAVSRWGRRRIDDYYVDPATPRLVARPPTSNGGDEGRSRTYVPRASRLSHRAARRRAESTAHVEASYAGVSGVSDDTSGLTTTTLRRLG